LNEPAHHPGNPNADFEFLAEVSGVALDASPGSAAPPLGHHRVPAFTERVDLVAQLDDRVDRITDLAEHGRDHLLGLPLQRIPASVEGNSTARRSCVHRTPSKLGFTDVYTESPGAQSLLTVFGGEHMLGGIHAYNAGDTTDESPDRVALVREASWAYLRSALTIDGTAWKQVQSDLATARTPIGRIDNK
jgi:hypothetical protein